MPFTIKFDCSKLEATGIRVPWSALSSAGDTSSEPSASESLDARLGRGGRLIFDRWNILEHAPADSQGLHLGREGVVDAQNPPGQTKVEEGHVQSWNSDWGSMDIKVSTKDRALSACADQACLIMIDSAIRYNFRLEVFTLLSFHSKHEISHPRVRVHCTQQCTVVQYYVLWYQRI